MEKRFWIMDLIIKVILNSVTVINVCKEMYKMLGILETCSLVHSAFAEVHLNLVFGESFQKQQIFLKKSSVMTNLCLQNFNLEKKLYLVRIKPANQRQPEVTHGCRRYRERRAVRPAARVLVEPGRDGKNAGICWQQGQVTGTSSTACLTCKLQLALLTAYQTAMLVKI